MILKKINKPITSTSANISNTTHAMSFSEIDIYITSKDTFENLTTISKNMNLGFIYITKKYSNIKNTYEVSEIIFNI